MKKHLLILIILATFMTGNTFGQSISATTYTFTKAGYAYAANMPSPITLLTAGIDEGASEVVPIGFNFWFDGVEYTHFSVESNGIIRLGMAAAVPEPVNDLASSTNVPKLAAYWDNLSTGTYPVVYQLDGVSPNRRLIVQWYPNGKRLQTWIWESGKIEFVYITAFAANANGYSIGIGNSSTDFASVTTTSIILNSTVAYGTANNNNTLGIAAGTKFTFNPVPPSAPTNLTFSNITLSSMQLDWTDITDELGYYIYKSLDNVNFTFAGQVAANITSFEATGLNPGMLYYWRVYSLREVMSLPLEGSHATTPTPLSGTYTIGPSGDFSTISDAVYTLAGSGFSSTDPVIFELMADYNSSVESFPVIFPATLPTTATNTLTLRPAADATALSLTSNASQTVRIDGADYITIDGRPGGTGTLPVLNIDNSLSAGSATSGLAIQLINGASNNIIRYCDITGVNASSAGAVIFIQTSNATTGNNNNLIEYCNIHNGATYPVCLMQISGTTAKENTANTVSNCNFFNWNLSTSGGYGRAVSLGGNTTGTILTGNSFYQTAPVINITQSTNGFIQLTGVNTLTNTSVTGNFIGGTEPLCAGAPLSLTYQTYYGHVQGISISAGSTLPTNIQGNTISNIEFIVPSGQGGLFTGISQSLGVVNVGTITPNIIGSTSILNSLTVSNNSSSMAFAFTGISASGASGSADQTNISNNVICGITMSGTGTGGTNFSGISLNSWYTPNVYVQNNTIGSSTLTNAITGNGGTITGISTTSRNNSHITSNTIANITQLNTAATGNQLIGIKATDFPVGSFLINDNTIHHLSTSSAITATGAAAGLIGILISTNSGTAHSVSRNSIHSLANTNTSASVAVTGISYSGPVSGTNVIARNLIHSFSLASSQLTAGMTGIQALAGVTAYQNNMIRLGIQSDGTPLTAGYNIQGIFDAAATTAGHSNKYYHNTVYIGGTGITGTTSATFAFRSTTLSNTTDIRNNIFINARSGGSGAKHYVVSVAGTSPNPAGFSSSHNILYASGETGAATGLYNGADQLTIADWQSASGLDALSVSADPALISPAGDLSTMDLHVQASTPIEGSGLLIATVTDDFDGQVRSGLTPTDIGADAGSFINNNDLFPPNITYTPLPNTGSTANTPLVVEITDGVAVSAGDNRPRLYFKKASDANLFTGNTSTDNGWKYVFASNTTSPYNFLMDYSIINGGSIAAGDVIQYFVAAQDDAHNFASKAAGATTSSEIDPVQHINGAPADAVLDAFIIINNNISGTFTVPGNFPNLTGPSGLFHAINIGTVTGDFTVQITGDLTEPGTVALNQFAAPHVMTIAPASASLKTITGNVDGGLIRFLGADNVVIDGRFNGSGNYLEFSNTGTGTASTNCALLFTNGATYNTVKYCTLKAKSESGPVIYFYAISTYTGNNSYNTIDHCNIDGSASVPVAISSYYNTTGGEHVSNTISGCNIFDFTTNGINLSYGSSAWTITGNSFYQTAPRVNSTDVNVLIITTGTNHIISGNYIGGSAPMAGGAPWTITGTGNYFRGMYLYSTINNFTVQNNTITNFNINTTTGANGFYGISLSNGNGTVSGNTIGSATTAGAISITRAVTSTDYGIYKIGTGSVTIDNNVIGGFTLSTSLPDLAHSFQAINYTGPAVSISGNTIGSSTVANSIHAMSAPTGSLVSQGVFGILASFSAGTGIVSNNTVSNVTNNYAGTGTYGVLRGISTSGAGSCTMINNIVSKLTSAAPITATMSGASIIGISDNATGSNKSIQRNRVTALTSSAATEQVSVTGIYAGAGSGSYFNNEVNLGRDAAGNEVTTGYAFNGIIDGAGTNTFYFNTVNISATAVTGITSSTFCFNSLTTGTRNIRNNLFVNTRSGGETGKHYAIKVAGTAPGQTNLTLDYNDYFVSGPALGFFNNADAADLTAWKTMVGKDVNSISINPLFTSATDLLPHENALNTGTPITGISTDINNNGRNPSSPTMGAYEAGPKTVNLTLFIEGLFAGGSTMNPAYNETGLQWPEGIADHFTVELHNSANYSTIELSMPDAVLNTSGSAIVEVPAQYNSTYYVTVKHRNGLETTTALPVDFSASTINVLFNNPANVFGGNLKNIGGTWVIFSGDVNQDGIVDSGDMTPVYNLATQATAGYIPEDVNGDGLIDSFDMTIIYNNASQAVGIMTP